MHRLIALACLLASVMSASAAEQRPNIVVILADDLGYADVGAQGRLKDIRTPHVDSIAAGGVRFTNGYVSCPVCSPTRAGLMTGRYQQRFGHEFNPGPNASPNFGLPLDQVTLPQALRSAGYATGMVGKWHLGNRPEMHPTRRGFDEFFGFLGGAHPYNAVGGGNNPLMRGTTPLESTDYLTDAFGREAAAFIDRHAADASSADGKPFFLYLAFNAVHNPQQATEKYLARFPGVTDRSRRLLLAKLSALDDAVGIVLEKLREKKLEENTLVIFFSDNGGPTPGNGSRNDPLHGIKGQTWEGGIRIPFMIRWPGGHVPAGKVDDRPVIALDIFPTALAAAGAHPTPANGATFDGVNLLPFIIGANDARPHEALFWRYGPQWAVRAGDLKLVQAPDERRPQLFDLAADIGEKNELSAQRPQDVKRLRGLYDQWNAKNEKARWRSTREDRRSRQTGTTAAAATQAEDQAD
jgi:arylsulfatase A-like enzyme